MNTQAVIVGIIIFAALIYISLQIWRKTQSFSVKKDCGAGCGCGTKSKKNDFI